MDRNTWPEEFDFNSKELDDLEIAKTELPNNSFLIEDMLNQGFDFIPLNSSGYSNTGRVDNLFTFFIVN